MTQEQTSKQITCPTCHGQTLWAQSNEFRPFCGERCRLIDLGDWFAEKNTIPCADQDTLE